MIDKIFLVLGYYLAQPLTWVVSIAAALIVARYPGWRLSFLVVSLTTYFWLMMIAVVRFEWRGMELIAKSYLPVSLVASAVSLAGVKLAWPRLLRKIQRHRVTNAPNQ